MTKKASRDLHNIPGKDEAHDDVIYDQNKAYNTREDVDVTWDRGEIPGVRI